MRTPMSSWWLLMIAYFIGSTVAGMISAALVSLFGFPYTWTGTLSLLLLGGILYLVYMRYSVETWLVAAAGIFILVSVIAIGRGLTATEPDIPPEVLTILETEDEFSPIREQARLTIPGFTRYENEYEDYERSSRIVETPLWILFALGSIGAGVGAVVLIRQGALRRSSPGGLVVEVRRLSGLQRLGVEAHTIDKVTDRAPVDEGAFLGLVNAQSPAGRGGLRTGDIVVGFGEKTIRSPRDLDNAAGRMEKGDVVAIKVLRHEIQEEIMVTF